MRRCGRTNVSQGKKSIGDGRDQQEMVLASFWHGYLHLCDFLSWNVADLTRATIFSKFLFELKGPFARSFKCGSIAGIFFSQDFPTFSHPSGDSSIKITASFFLVAWNAPHLTSSSYRMEGFFPSIRLGVGKNGVEF